MLFVSILTAKAGLSPEQTQETLRRRLEWTPPEGMKILGEYWLQGAPGRVIAIIESESPAPIFLVDLQWGDAFDIEVVPAMTAEEGLRVAQLALQQAAARPPAELRR